MSTLARDVIRYLKALEETEGYYSTWHQSPDGFFYQKLWITADGHKARQLDLIEEYGSLAAANVAAAAKYIKGYIDANPETFSSSCKDYLGKPDNLGSTVPAATNKLGCGNC